jgi:hypothetical protein
LDVDSLFGLTGMFHVKHRAHFSSGRTMFHVKHAGLNAHPESCELNRAPDKPIRLIEPTPGLICIHSP